MKLHKKQLKIAKYFLIIAIFAMLFEWHLPHIALAAEFKEAYAQGPVDFALISTNPDEHLEVYTLPENSNKEPKMVRYVTITAYSSTVDQCDSTPFITANGTYVHDGVIAANFLPFGTKVKIPEFFGDKVFSVEDRMNKKYYYRMDIWMPNRAEAINFGVKYLKIEVY